MIIFFLIEKLYGKYTVWMALALQRRKWPQAAPLDGEKACSSMFCHNYIFVTIEQVVLAT